ncbi:hypothetical protein [Nonomuraea salmonea]|uniref:hypothetical protein n=1 Tax=Nonomuraea salmonea TaxID=46181 RepID=UPI0031E8C294
MDAGGGVVSARPSLRACRTMICPLPSRSQKAEAASSSLDRSMIFSSLASAGGTVLRPSR